MKSNRVHLVNEGEPRNMISRWIGILRGIAILGVIVYHTSIVMNLSLDRRGIEHSAILSYVTELGRFGPFVFFFVSGVLLSRNYRNNGESGPVKRAVFWRRRLAKIAPLWVLFIAITVVEAPFAKDHLLPGAWGNVGENHNDATIIFLAVFFITFINSVTWGSLPPGGWSIASEIYAYIFFAWNLERSIKWILNIVLILMAIDVAIYVSQSAWQNLSILQALFGMYARVHIATVLMFFVSGMCCQIYSDTNDALNRQESWQHHRPMWIRLIAIYCLSIFSKNLHGSNLEGLSVLALGALLAYAIFNTSYVDKGCVWMGRYSYSLYFAHFQIILVFNFLTIPTLITNFLSSIGGDFAARNLIFPILLTGVLGVSISLAWVINLVFEAPMHRFLSGKPSEKRT